MLDFQEQETSSENNIIITILTQLIAIVGHVVSVLLCNIECCAQD